MAKNNVLQTFKTEISKIASLDDLLLLETKYFGRNGVLNAQLKNMKDLNAEKRKALGKEMNQLKYKILESISKKRQEIVSFGQKNTIDVTLPGKKYASGSLHLVTYAIEEISNIFEKIGFIRMSYPEIEWEWFSFEALNMPKDHPARDDFETFYIQSPTNQKYGKMILTPHTSSGQPREMMRLGKPPIRMINISKCYRPNWDPTHTPMFHQFEGLCVDSGITIANLKGTLDHFAEKYFGKGTKTRLRPHHFQFTEPSFEVDISCNNCRGTAKVDGNKCRVCKSGWLELGGCGMVHPNVLKEGGIDSKKHSGWAFGFGIERVIMMKYGLDDIRNYYSGDIRFLEQF